MFLKGYHVEIRGWRVIEKFLYTVVAPSCEFGLSINGLQFFATIRLQTFVND